MAGPLVSLTLIVKNEQGNLEPCISRLNRLVDEIIVVDTGSTDQTKSIALKLGAKVFDFKWVDDFAAARNEAIRHARGRWIFWLDADDRIDDENRRRLKRLFDTLGDENTAYHMTCQSIDRTGATVTDHVRLFRNLPVIRWKHRIHEQILPAIRAAGGVSRPTDIVIHHTGYADAALHARKLQRNLHLLEMERTAEPDSTSVLYHLGSNYTALGRPAEAIPVLQHGLNLAKPGEPFERKFYGQLARAHHELKQRQESLDITRRGTSRFPDDAELTFLQSALLSELDQLPEAERVLLSLLDPARKFVGSDLSLTGFKARQNLAMLYRRQNRLADAERELRLVVAEQPAFAPGRLALADVALAQNSLREVPQILAPIQNVSACAVDVALLTARALLAGGDLPAARDRLESACNTSPGNLRLLSLLTQVLLQQGSDSPAIEKTLRAILKIDPQHTGARQTLTAMGLAC